ncbi:MAG TPA: peptidylprolyl isomerase [Blastococcus sp.]|nr:peptidylprolyl isomerase [Blastococcus sp.]
MLNRRLARGLATGFLLAVAVSGLAACRTSPSVAAYVGDAQVTVAELDAAVAQRLEDDDVADFAESSEDDYTRRVLSLLVQEEVYAVAAERFDVRVSDDTVRARIDELLGDDDPDTVYAQLAQQGVAREDVFENVRQQLIRQGIAEAEGKAEGLSDEALRGRYEEVREDFAEVSFGYITVPDQATAVTVLAQLTADPASYPAVAARYPGTYTLPALESRSPDELPAVLSEGVAAAAPNTGFSVPVPETGGIVVTFVEGTVYPPFEEVRPQLEGEAGDAADAAGTELVNEVRDDLGVTVNPRFGVLEEGRLVPGDSGVVDILGDEEPTDGAAAPAE